MAAAGWGAVQGGEIACGPINQNWLGAVDQLEVALLCTPAEPNRLKIGK